MVNVVEVKRSAIQSVTLELNADELAYLCTCLVRTGGNMTRSLRKHSESIGNALIAAGIEPYKYARSDLVDKQTHSPSSIYFMDGE
jgi:hypothetical protein